MSDFLFLDTEYLVALMRKRDTHHRRALSWQQWLDRTNCSLVTTEAVLWETLNTLSDPPTRPMAAAFYQQCHTESRIRMIGMEPVWMTRAFQMYATRLDKEWSLTDCLSFEVMAELGISDALAYDHHFTQAGHIALLRNDPPQ